MDISPTTETSETVLGLGLAEEPSPAGGSRNPQITPPAQTGQSHIAARRMSTISLSSLNRPSFPHKLDLSSATLGMNPDLSMFANGLASPVTLAPKSARPSAANDLPPDLLAMTALAGASALNDPSARGVDIDLTLSGSSPSNALGNIGNSADKPIELDLELDMDMDLFGDSTDNTFSPAAGVPASLPGVDDQINVGDHAGGADAVLNLDDLGSFAPSAEASTSDLFQSLGAGEPTGIPDPQQSSQQLGIPGTGDVNMAPSPGSILASFAASGSGSQDASAADGDQSYNFGLNLPNLDSFDESGFFSEENQADAGADMASLHEMLNFTDQGTGI
jgi:hypothetical protein